MKCIHCGKLDFREKRIEVEAELRGQLVKVKTQAFVCIACNEPLMTAEQMSGYQINAADAYRTSNKLLTSHEIIKMREALEMTQVEFAEYLGVGVASISRWEKHSIQDKAQDELLRLKCDPHYADKNLTFVSSAMSPADEFSGNRKFDSSRLLVMSLKFLPLAHSPLYVNKAAFYADFHHYRENGCSITGSRYKTLQHGPCPEHYSRIFSQAKLEGFVEEKKGNPDLKLVKELDDLIFTKSELVSIAFVSKILEKKGPRFLYESSHKERGYKQTKSLEFLSYRYAKDLLI